MPLQTPGHETIARTRSGCPAKKDIRRALATFLGAESYPCVAAKSINNRGALTLETGRDISRSGDDVSLYQSLRRFLASPDSEAGQPDPFRTFVMTYAGPVNLSEERFESALWDRLQNLHNFDAILGIPWDDDVSGDPKSPEFCMSIAGRAFFIVGLHPNASRPARRFAFPSLVFNLHAQFEQLRKERKYERMKSVIRERDEEIAGSVNPMLSDFGHHSEAVQYSGRHVDELWQCPLARQRAETPDDQ